MGDKDWGTGVGDIGWGKNLGSQIGDVVLGTQTGGHRVLTLVQRPRLGDKLGTWAGVRGWGPRLGGPGRESGVGGPNWADRTW